MDPNESQLIKSLSSKVEFLEKTLSAFQVEVDGKLKIVEQILSNRTEQVTVQKKFLEQEETLYNYLLNSWKNNIPRNRQFCQGQDVQDRNVFNDVSSQSSGSEDPNSSVQFTLGSAIISGNVKTSGRRKELGRPHQTQSPILIGPCHVPFQVTEASSSSSHATSDTSTNAELNLTSGESISTLQANVIGSNGEEQSQFYTSNENEVESQYELYRENEEGMDSSIDIKHVVPYEIIVGNVGENVPTYDDPISISTVEESVRNISAFKCPVCGKISGSSEGLRKHIQLHKRNVSFTCSQCNKQFPRKANLDRHMLRHESAGALLCHDCPGEEFYGKDKLVEHMTSCHGIRKPWTCTFCNTCFAQRKNLQQHILSVHPGMKSSSSRHLDKRIPCSLCSKTYGTRNDLEVHLRSVHTGDRPFHCLWCQKTFADRRNLKKHMVADSCSRNLERVTV